MYSSNNNRKFGDTTISSTNNSNPRKMVNGLQVLNVTDRGVDFTLEGDPDKKRHTTYPTTRRKIIPKVTPLFRGPYVLNEIARGQSQANNSLLANQSNSKDANNSSSASSSLSWRRKNELDEIFNRRVKFQSVFNEFFRQLTVQRMRKNERLGSTQPLSFDTVLMEFFSPRSKILQYYQNIDPDMGTFVKNAQKLHMKNDTKSQKIFNNVVERGTDADYSRTLNNLNNALVIGSEDMSYKIIEQRAKFFFARGDYVNAARDIELLLSYWECEDSQLVKMGCISFFLLAKNAVHRAEDRGLRYALANLANSEQLLQRLKLHAEIEPSVSKELQSICLRLRLNPNDIEKDFQLLREEISMIYHERNNVRETQQEKHLNYTNIFADGKIWMDRRGNLIAAKEIEPDEKIFYEMIMAILVDESFRHQYCVHCNRQLGYRVFPCHICNEVVFCDPTCRYMAFSMKHQRVCRFSVGYLYDITGKDSDMALCYEMFSQLPIRQVCECAELPIGRTYYNLLENPEWASFPLVAFYNFLLRATTKQNDIAKVDMMEERYQKMFWKSLQLCLLMKHQFVLTSNDIVSQPSNDDYIDWESDSYSQASDDSEEDADDEEEEQESDYDEEQSDEQLLFNKANISFPDLSRLVRAIFLTFLAIEKCPIVQQPGLMLKTWKPPPPGEENQPPPCDVIGRGVGTFGTQIKHSCLHKSNVRRRFANNGKLEYIATKTISQGEPLLMYHHGMVPPPPEHLLQQQRLIDPNSTATLSQLGYCHNGYHYPSVDDSENSTRVKINKAKNPYLEIKTLS